MRTGASLALPACPLLSDPGFSALRRYIIALTGLNYYEERRADLAVRIWARMRAAGTPDAAAYLERLRGDDADGKRERAQLIDDIAIGETYFFRFAEQFRALQDHVLPLLIRTEAASRSLNIWSAGCANGAEAYSLSILLKRSFGDALRNWSVSILATDLNARAIERARLAVYTPWALRTLDAPTRRDCFDPLPDGSFRLRARYREGVEFRVHNLLHADPPAPETGNEGRGFDLVFCRNVLIYFDDQSISRTLRTLTETLGPGGWLFLGHAEAAMVRGASAAALRTVAFTGTYVYQRVESNGDGSGTLPVLAAPADTFVAGSPGEAPSFVLPLLPEQTPAAKPAPRSTPDADSPADARRAVRSLLDVGDTRTALDRLEPLLAGAASPGVG
ncbi:MAG TPA: protein-glutamate O-methyltransferase CheR, partial [Armatimonadaceae bacterium]|nr:protein-glutamate O-methyltransferase CheR [Armatimonadaceae bacterium]